MGRLTRISTARSRHEPGGALVIDDLEHEGRPNLVSVNGAVGSLGVRLQLLGPIALEVADEPVALSPQQRRLLAAIAVGPASECHNWRRRQR